jgi:hypothetical protein
MPYVINTDKAGCYGPAIEELKKDRGPDLAQRSDAGVEAGKSRGFKGKQTATTPIRGGGVHRARILE